MKKPIDKGNTYYQISLADSAMNQLIKKRQKQVQGHLFIQTQGIGSLSLIRFLQKILQIQKIAKKNTGITQKQSNNFNTNQFGVLFYSIYLNTANYLTQFILFQMQTAFDFACGLMAGWSQLIIGQPFDFLKTKSQLSNDKICMNSLKKFAREIIKQYGVLGMYRGSSSLFFGFPFIIGLEFTVYEACKKMIMETKYSNAPSYSSPQEVLHMWDILRSGATVGASVSLIYCPIEYTKILRQTGQTNNKGSLSLLFSEIWSGNIKHIYRGFTAGLLREIFGGAIYYSTYEGTIRAICHLQGKGRNQSGVKQFLLSGAMAGITYWTLIYPLDMIKTRRQSGQSYEEIFKKVRQNSYKGYGVMAARSVIVNSFSFAVFEYMKSVFKFINVLMQY